MSTAPPLIMPTPRRLGGGAVDFIPNLLLSTFLVAAAPLPVGAQLSQGVVPTPLYLPKVDVYPNLILSTFSAVVPAALPLGSQWSVSAPPPKYQPQVDISPNNLILGIAPQPLPPALFTQQLSQSAPQVKYTPQVDAIPNLIGTTLHYVVKPPFTPPVFPPTPSIPSDSSSYLFVLTYAPATMLPAPVLPVPLVMPTPRPLPAVQVLAVPNYLPLTLPAPNSGTPVAKNKDFSQLQVKYEVTSLHFDNPILPKKIPVPSVVVLRRHEILSYPQQKYDVFDFNYLHPNSQIPPIPAVGPPGPPITITGLTRPGGTVVLNPKKAGETLPIQFNFLSALGTGETISGASTTASVHSGIDPNPAELISGGSVVSGTVVQQEVTGGVVGCIYDLLCTANTSLGNVIEISAFLAIEADLI